MIAVVIAVFVDFAAGFISAWALMGLCVMVIAGLMGKPKDGQK